jgi:serine/threonine-protein kinase HipA
MARNQHAVVWTNISGTAQKMGDLVLTEQQSLFTYTKDYLNSDQAGLSLLTDASIWGSDTVNYPVSERIPVFPRLLSLIPGNNPRNLQRRHYLNILRSKLGKEPPPGLETEWQLLVMGGHGGIGHIDIFKDDLRAENWYQSSPVEALADTDSASPRSELWRMLKHDVLDENVDFNPQIIEETLGPTPSVGGMIPKLLVSIDTRSTAKPHFYPPNKPGTNNTPHTDVVLKIEPPEYKGLLDLEALCLDLHKQAGFEVPAHYRYSHDGLELLAIERFDRKNSQAIPMESLFSVIATGDHQFRETGDILLNELGGIIQQLGQVASLPENTGEQLYRRFLMALLTGNGDLHLENISLLGGLSDCRLSPIYDPAPMRAWPRHNIISAIPFDPAAYTTHSHFFVDLGKSFGLGSEQIHHLIGQALKHTASYSGQVMDLQNVPLTQREQLAKIVDFEHKQLSQITMSGEGK